MARGEAGAGNISRCLRALHLQPGRVYHQHRPGVGQYRRAAWWKPIRPARRSVHITGQIETQYLDKKLSYIHEAPDQLTMLKSRPQGNVSAC